MRGLRSARPGRRGRATGGAGAPHAPACLLPSSRRRCLSALNLVALSSAPQHFESHPPHTHLPTGQVLPRGLGPRPPRGSAPGGAARDTRTPPLRLSSRRGAAHACLLGRDSETRPPSRLEVMRWGSDGGHALLSGWSRPYAWFPGCSGSSTLRVSPRGPRWGLCLVASAACWSWDIFFSFFLFKRGLLHSFILRMCVYLPVL